MKKTKEDRADLIKSDISFMEYKIQQYSAQLKTEKATKGTPPQWWGDDHRLDHMANIYKDRHEKEVAFLESCIAECARIKGDLEEKLSRLETGC